MPAQPDQNPIDPLPSALQARATDDTYSHLRDLARRCIQRVRRGNLLQTTVLANEAWLRLRGRTGGPGPLAAATVLRNVLIDLARHEGAAKRGQGWRRVPLRSSLPDPQTGPSLDLLDLESALAHLERTNPRAVRIVELRYFAGMSVAGAAAALGVSERTVEAEFRLARALLRAHLESA